MSNYNSLLHDIYIFKELSDPELQEIGGLVELKELEAGEDIFSQGAGADAFYIIKSGSVRIHQKSSAGDNIEVAVLGGGSHFGEMSFVDGEARSAAATTIEKSEVIHIDYNKFRDLLAENPAIAVKAYKALAHFLCGRLRVTTNDLSFAREVNLRHF